MIRFCIRNPFIALTLTALAVAWGWAAWSSKTVDAIPDISENQTVVVTEWPGRSPEDVEDQITYPLATTLSGVKGVKEIRGLSGFGFSQIYVVFEEDIRFSTKGMVEDFYEARTRVLEKLASVGQDLPEGVTPELGPDATALGQVFWYTVEGPQDLAALRGIQDWTVRYELQTVPGVAEVASVGGMVREYQVDVDPNLLRYYGVGLMDVVRAIRSSNRDVGAKTIEAAGIEYVVRGLGFIKGVKDLEETVVGVTTAAGFRPAAGMAMGAMGDGRGAGPRLPMAKEMPHSPVRVKDVAGVRIGPAFRRGALADDRAEQVGGVVVMRFGANPRDVIAKVRDKILAMNDPASGLLPPGVRVVPFYDRTQLIDETVETLETALLQELWITVAVVVLFLLHLRSSLIIAATLPIAVMLSFVAMAALGVDSNIMSLTGIAIAIGTMVDMGVIMTENIYRALVDNRGARPRREVIEEAALEVAPALMTAIATTIVSFVPIFFLTDMEGKLFRPLAWTKTFALAAAAITGVLVVPVLCRVFLRAPSRERVGRWGPLLLALPFGWIAARAGWLGLRGWIAGPLAFGLAWLAIRRMAVERMRPVDENPVSHGIAGWYERWLRWILAHKALFFVGPLVILVLGIAAGAGLGQEFMPPLDEGSLLYMPSLLPQAGLTETMGVMKRQNAAMMEVPEVARVVGKLGRAESALDPAPVGMLETVVQLKPKDQWRPGYTKADIRRELMGRVHTPGATEGAGAWLQPIETRVIMLNSGIRAPLAVKLIGAPKGPDGRPLHTKAAVQKLEAVAGRIRDRISRVPGVAGPNVENIGSKPYLEFEIHRERVGHYGLTLGDVQESIMTAIGGATVTRTLEGRERYPVRVAYARELRDKVEALETVLVEGVGGLKVPLTEVATVHEVIGPAAIKTEDGRLRLHVTFAASGRDEGRVMEDVIAEVARVELPEGVAAEPAGRYESQVRARKRFAVLIPVCFAIILFLLYLNFRSWPTVLNVFAAVPVVIAGGLILLWAYPHLWDLAYEVGLADRPSAGPIYITVAVVVGFIALLGIATDDGVVMATRLEQQFKRRPPRSVGEIRDNVVEAGLLRVRPCLMTTFTTILALMPILASSGTGSDVAQPMAIPAVGGMLAELISLFIVPCVYCLVKESQWRRAQEKES